MWVRQCDIDATNDAPLPIPARIASNEEFIPPPQSEQQKEDGKSLSAAERDARMKDWRKTNGGPNREEWEKMSPEQREAKRKEIKERLEQRISELRAKQTNATITAQETSELGRSEKILKRFEQTGPPPPRGEHPKAPEPNAPLPK